MKLIIANEFTDLKDDEVLISPLNGNNVFELEDVASSECTSIRCYLTDKIPSNIIAQVVKGYVSKLRRGGSISFSGTDINQLVIGVKNRQINVLQANQLIFGGPESYNMNNGLYANSDIAAILQECGLKITKKSLDGLQYVVEGQRN